MRDALEGAKPRTDTGGERSEHPDSKRASRAHTWEQACDTVRPGSRSTQTAPSAVLRALSPAVATAPDGPPIPAKTPRIS